MSNTKHTPGSWVYKDNQIMGDDGKELVATVYGFDTFEKRANGKLIASAPELLEALKALLNANTNDGSWNFAASCDNARRIIREIENQNQ